MQTQFSNSNEPLLNVYDDGYLRVEHECFTVFCNKQYVKLSRTEFLILSRLVQTPKMAVSPKDLWRKAWEQRKIYNPLSLHVYLYRLRRKLKPFDIFIETAFNEGYRFVPHQQKNIGKR